MRLHIAHLQCHAPRADTQPPHFLPRAGFSHTDLHQERSSAAYTVTMAGLQYQAVHIRTLLGVSRTDVQRWLSSLPPFNSLPTQARTARTFTIGDLAFFSVVAMLHQRLDMPLRTIAGFSARLHALMNAPAASNAMPARYFLNQESGTWEVGAQMGGDLSLAIDPIPLWRAVYEFVGLEPNPQAHLQFGLMALPSPSVEPSNARRAS